MPQFFASASSLRKRWLFVLLTLASCSCVSSEQTNPLRNQVEELFIPAITRPLSGEQWFTGSNREINWRFPRDVSDSLVTLQVFCDDQLLEVIENVPNTGSYSWAVPNQKSRSCQIHMIIGSGQMVTSGKFIVTDPPILEQLDIGGPGWEPSALREFIIFTSSRSGNADLWLKNRRTGDLVQLTFHPDVDGESNLFKPNGNVLAFASGRSGREEIWMMSITTRKEKQVTKTGGSNPAWQPSFFQFPTVAYKRSAQGRTHIYATRLQIPTTDIVPLPVTIPVFPEDQVTSGSSSLGSLSNIKTLDWGTPGVDNVIIYDIGNAPGTLWRLDVPFEGIAINGRDQPDFFTCRVCCPLPTPLFRSAGQRLLSAVGAIYGS